MRLATPRPHRLSGALAVLVASASFGCGGGSGGGEGGGVDPGLTPNSIDFEVDVESTLDSLQVVDLVFSPDDCAVEEGAVLSPGRRRLLRFDTVVANMGELDCRIGDPADPEPPISPDAFEYQDCHGHYHLKGYASYELRFPDGTLAAIGHKQSFCITDSVPVVVGSPSSGYDCDFQGLSSGWADVYDRGVPGQWVDVRTGSRST
jgi:lysyl oxidase